jgi:hypothetical protein
MPKKELKKEFQVTARVVMIVQRSIACESLEEALLASKGWNIDDYISLEEGSGYEDASLQVTGVADFNKHFDTEQ